ncbi:MAG: shikimate kinase [Candidatus Omnitrophota bacterium]|jgi:shikimate kinase
MGQKNIVFIGFMGSGKTLVSRELEKSLPYKRISTDDLIEEREGITIAEIFEQKGEAYFRSLEKIVIDEISQQCGLIVDCGGGVVLNPKNIEKLRKTGIVINLAVTAEQVLKNTKGSTHRPLLQDDDPLKKIRTLLDERRPLYKNADYSIISDGRPIPELIQDVLKVIENV